MKMNYSTRNCEVPCCNGQHFIKFIDGKAMILSWEFFEIVRHYDKNIAKLCGIVWLSDKLCHIHKKLNCLHFFSNYIRDKNINNDIIISKIRDNCQHRMCLNNWCFEIRETEYVGYKKPISYRARYL